MLTISGMTDSEKNDIINFIYGQLSEREAQKELRKSQRETKKYKEMYEALRALDNPEDVA